MPRRRRKGFGGDVLNIAKDAAMSVFKEQAEKKIRSLTKTGKKKPKAKTPRPSRRRKMANNSIGGSRPSSTRALAASYGTVIRGSKDNSVIRLNRREVVTASFNTSVSFNATSIGVNPGNALLGRWTASLAHLYELFEYKHISFTYYPGSSTDNKGSCFMQFEPDYSDDAPTTLEQVLTQPNSVVFPTWGDGGPVTLVVPHALLTPINTNAKWVQNAGQSGTADFNDRNTLGVFRFGSVGAVSPALAGTIEVNYQLVLRSPQNHPIYNNFGHWTNLITTGGESAYLTNSTVISGTDRKSVV